VQQKSFRITMVTVLNQFKVKYHQVGFLILMSDADPKF